MGSSVNKYLVSFRAMAVYAYEDGLHDNDRALGCFSKRKVEESDKAAGIHLTETELQALADMELTGLKDQVRDIFLVGCYTCQRVSGHKTQKTFLDYIKLSSDEIADEIDAIVNGAKEEVF